MRRTSCQPVSQTFRPQRSLLSTILLDLSPVTMGTALAVVTGHWLVIVMAVVGVLLSGRCLLSSYVTFRTHFLVNDERIALIWPHGGTALAWEQITAVVIRQRPSITAIDRADRQVVLSGPDDQKMALNMSVLSESDEATLLEIIESRVTCPIHRIDDGILSTQRLER